MPGNNASNNISASLSGLPGNIYHYRLDAANDFGIVYGEDQSFTVGFAPTATTLPPTNGSNGATLEALSIQRDGTRPFIFNGELPPLPIPPPAWISAPVPRH